MQTHQYRSSTTEQSNCQAVAASHVRGRQLTSIRRRTEQNTGKKASNLEAAIRRFRTTARQDSISNILTGSRHLSACVWQTEHFEERRHGLLCALL